MNEVKGNQPAGAQPSAIVPSGKASSTKGDIARAEVSSSGNNLPTKAIEDKREETGASVASADKVIHAVTQMNQFVQSEHRDLLFSVDENTGTSVVRVTDRESGDLIRQIPSEVFLKLAEHAQRDEPIHLINVEG